MYALKFIERRLQNLLDIHAREKQSLMGHVHSLDVRVGIYESLNPSLEEHDQLNNAIQASHRHAISGSHT